MIEHLRIDFSPTIKAQTLLHLGRVNILTGRNSSGKSTILRRIAEAPDSGITFHKSKGLEEVIRGPIPSNYVEPSPAQISEWIRILLDLLEGKILFSSSESDASRLTNQARESSPLKTYSLDFTQRVAKALVAHASQGDTALLLSPKRRLPHQIPANPMAKLDSEAADALSRLFYLQSQSADTPERLIFEHVHSSFQHITGNEFGVRLLGDRNPPVIQLEFRRGRGPWIPSQNEGLGLPEVLSIILYSLDGENKLLLLEEPENHLHPDLQRKLLTFLNSVPERQFILSTHSPVFLNPALVDRIYFCKYQDGQILIDDNTKRAHALSDIGVLAIDNLTSDAVVITEGKTDLIVIDHIVRNWLGAPTTASISHVFLGGSMMKFFDPSPFAEVRNTFALLDLDTSNADAQKALIENCRSIHLEPVQLTRYCLENYYTLSAVRAAFGELVPEGLAKLDPKTPPWTQLADETHSAEWWKGELKSSRRITSILSAMSKTDIEATDLLAFCTNIKNAL